MSAQAVAQAVHRGRRLRVVVAAVRERRAQRIALAGRHVDRVVADGGERRGRGALGLGRRAAQPAEHPGQDAERDGGLEVPPLARAAGQQLAQRAQRGDLVLLVPERLEQRRVLLVGRPDHLGRECADALGQRQPVATRERGVGHQRRCAGRAVDQRHRLARVLDRARRERAEEVPERQDLAAAAVALRGHGGQRSALEHPCDRARELGPHARVALDHACQAGQHDAAHDALGQRLAERCAGAAEHARQVAALIGIQQRRRTVAGARRDAVDERGRIALDEREERLARRAHALGGALADDDAGALTGDAAVALEVDVGTALESDRARRLCGAHRYALLPTCAATPRSLSAAAAKGE